MEILDMIPNKRPKVFLFQNPWSFCSLCSVPMF